MKINCDFSERYNGHITADGKVYNLIDFISSSSKDCGDKNSEIVLGLAKHFFIDGVNYAHLMNYLIRNSSGYFSNPGTDIIIAYISALEHLIKEDVELEVEDAFTGSLVECARPVCRAKGVKLRIIKEHYPHRFLDPIHNSPLFVRNGLRARIFARYKLGRLRAILGKTDHTKANVLIPTNIRFSAKDETKNQLFGGIANDLKQKGISYKFLRYEQLTQTSNFIRFIKEYSHDKISYIGDYYKLRTFLSIEHDFSEIRKRWRVISDKPEVKALFVYKGVNFYHVIKPRLELVFNALAYIAADNKNITREIIEKENYKVLIIDHEENMYGKGFMLNTRLDKSKKTVALSHELIYPGCIHTHIKNEEARRRSSPLWRPLPDIKCVWGDFSKRVLEETCNYPNGIINATGNPKFDVLLKEKFNTREIMRRYKLSRKPKLLFALDCSPILYSIAREIAVSCPNFEIILKPHPNEDMGPLKESLRKNSPPNLRLLSKHANTYDLIAASDYVATIASTVGFEAMLLGKIVFIMNFAGIKIAGLPYVESGAAIEVRSVEEFKASLEKLKEQEYRCQILLKKNTFVKGLHPGRGTATKSVGRIVSSLLRSKIYLKEPIFR